MTCAYSSPRRDFGLHKMAPVEFHQPDPYVPSEENMDLLTTYKQDFNYVPVCQVGAIKPRDSKFPNGDKTQYLPTYKGERRILERTGQAYRTTRKWLHVHYLRAKIGIPLLVSQIWLTAYFCTDGKLRMALK